MRYIFTLHLNNWAYFKSLTYYFYLFYNHCVIRQPVSSLELCITCILLNMFINKTKEIHI